MKKIFEKFKPALFALMVIFFLAALPGFADMEQKARVTGQDTGKLVMDPALKLEVKAREVRLEDGTTLLQLDIHNPGRWLVKGYRIIEWFDANGMKIKSLDARWLPFAVQARSSMFLRFASPRPDAASHLVQFKKDIK